VVRFPRLLQTLIFAAFDIILVIGRINLGTIVN